jgi:hypothetical protein
MRLIAEKAKLNTHSQLQAGDYHDSEIFQRIIAVKQHNFQNSGRFAYCQLCIGFCFLHNELNKQVEFQSSARFAYCLLPIAYSNKATLKVRQVCLLPIACCVLGHAF